MKPERGSPFPALGSADGRGVGQCCLSPAPAPSDASAMVPGPMADLDDAYEQLQRGNRRWSVAFVETTTGETTNVEIDRAHRRTHVVASRGRVWFAAQRPRCAWRPRIGLTRARRVRRRVASSGGRVRSPDRLADDEGEPPDALRGGAAA
jgi:hypothetical protein